MKAVQPKKGVARPSRVAERPETLIEVRGLLSQFGERVIHQDLDLDVMRGEVLDRAALDKMLADTRAKVMAWNAEAAKP